MLEVHHAFGALSLRCVENSLLVHLDYPLGWLYTILELFDVLALLLRDSWEFKEVDRVDIHLGNKEGIEILLGCKS